MGIVAGRERIEVVNAFADADKINRQRAFFGNGYQDSAFGRTVKFGDDQAVNRTYFPKGLYLIQSILAGGRVYGEQGLVRRFGDNFLNNPGDFFSSSISPVLFCKRPAVSMKTMSSFWRRAS